MAERVSVQIAFEGGQTVSVNAPRESAQALVQALGGDGRVFELPSDDGTYFVSLAKVVFVRQSDRETSIGFGSAP